MKAGQRGSGACPEQPSEGAAGRYRLSARPPVRLSPGFTLVEMLVTLVLAGMIALLAHGIFGAALYGSAEIQQVRGALDRKHGAQRLLTAMFLSVDVGSRGETVFHGRPDRIEFSAWLQTPDGWFERSRVELSADGHRLIAVTPRSSPIVLADSVAAVEFGYLLQPGAEARWVSEWISQVTAPLAVRVRLTRAHRLGRVVADTMVYLIKARG